jgi:hypothetical protein
VQAPLAENAVLPVQVVPEPVQVSAICPEWFVGIVEGEQVKLAVTVTPRPTNVTGVGLNEDGELVEVKFNVSVFAPSDVGVNVTVTVQVALLASVMGEPDVPQVFDAMAYCVPVTSEAYSPVTVPLAVLVIVTDLLAEVMFVLWFW